MPFRHRWALAFALVIAACGSKHKTGIGADRCAAAVATTFAAVGTAVNKDEAQAQKVIADATLAACQREGISPHNADCIRDATGDIEQRSDFLQTCLQPPLPSWLILMPPRAERQASGNIPPIPDGPTKSTLVFTQLAVGLDTSCGLRDGRLQCWGKPLSGFAGEFAALGGDENHMCAITSTGSVMCVQAGALALPSLALTIPPGATIRGYAGNDQAGCALLQDGTVTCVGDKQLPALRYRRVQFKHEYGCGLDVDGKLHCVGDVPSELPVNTAFDDIDLVGACGIRSSDHKLSCWGSIIAPVADQSQAFRSLACSSNGCCAIDDKGAALCFGPAGIPVAQPPAGQYDTVVTSRTHTCVVSKQTGNACFGGNDWGACNVPQPSAN